MTPDLADFVTADDVRQINLDFFDSKLAEYLRTGAFAATSPDKTRQRIRNVQDSKIRGPLKAVTLDDGAHIPTAWSHYMALAAGRHLWPDANHRTAMATFTLATERAVGLAVALDPHVAEALVVESKRMRDADFLKIGRYYTVEELSDPGHPYRQVFTKRENELQIVAEGA